MSVFACSELVWDRFVRFLYAIQRGPPTIYNQLQVEL